MTNRIFKASPRSGNEIDQIAYEIIKRVQPHVLSSPQPFDVELLFELHLSDLTGVETTYDNLPQGIYGVTALREMTSVVSITMVDDSSQLGFSRSTIGHECGHSIIHVPEFRRKRMATWSSYQGFDDGMIMYRQNEVAVYENPEWQAHRFSGALLMPLVTVKLAVTGGAKEADLADIFKVTIPFVVSRLKALKIEIAKGGMLAHPPFSRSVRNLT
ncbi:MAG: ImmA/IrrE family metallo-endopeptidase [Desulfofustis sp. PB-SRB1]|nr:ImmA/IrrE family metallo-endopeptidase [Desulfofustis sp. PB-SRB1]HBH28182.1 ImmA/IrrE family metallo-endopeptidase [Desulfofustis sp.]